MPTLVRLLTALAIIAGVTFAAMAALVFFVEPRRAVIEVEVPLRALEASPPAAAAPAAEATPVNATPAGAAP